MDISADKIKHTGDVIVSANEKKNIVELLFKSGIDDKYVYIGLSLSAAERFADNISLSACKLRGDFDVFH